MKTNRGDVLLANAMRATGLTARGLAQAIDVAPAVVSRWQTGTRQPRGPACALLRVLAREPEAALRALGQEAKPKKKKAKAKKKTVKRTSVTPPPLERNADPPVSADPHGFAGDGGPPEGNYDIHLGYLGGQED